MSRLIKLFWCMLKNNEICFIHTSCVWIRTHCVLKINEKLWKRNRIQEAWLIKMGKWISYHFSVHFIIHTWKKLALYYVETNIYKNECWLLELRFHDVICVMFFKCEYNYFEFLSSIFIVSYIHLWLSNTCNLRVKINFTYCVILG